MLASLADTCAPAPRPVVTSESTEKFQLPARAAQPKPVAAPVLRCGCAWNLAVSLHQEAR
ncbi:MAG: hypothetical protein KC910_19210 [Candidatus Eremiobacteraeota bacterium]|nr:hypothetical protein [Candidatus Eremiobacteraeota bacterium]